MCHDVTIFCGNWVYFKILYPKNYVRPTRDGLVPLTFWNVIISLQEKINYSLIDGKNIYIFFKCNCITCFISWLLRALMMFSFWLHIKIWIEVSYGMISCINYQLYFLFQNFGVYLVAHVWVVYIGPIYNIDQ